MNCCNFNIQLCQWVKNHSHSHSFLFLFIDFLEGRSLSTTKEKYVAAAEEWRGLTEEEKNEYKDKAKDFMTTKEVTWPKVQKIMKQMHYEVILVDMDADKMYICPYAWCSMYSSPNQLMVTATKFVSRQNSFPLQKWKQSLYTSTMGRFSLEVVREDYSF